MNKSAIEYTHPVIGTVFVQKESIFGQFISEKSRMKFHRQICTMDAVDYKRTLQKHDPEWLALDKNLVTLYLKCYPNFKIDTLTAFLA